MKMIVHHRQKQVRLRIDETQAIPVMATIKESSQELFYFLINLVLTHKWIYKYSNVSTALIIDIVDLV